MRGILVALLICLFSLNLTDEPSIGASELHCLALNIYHEARGESVRGQIAVGQVTINRLRHKAFPRSICGVVLQPFQFSWVKQISGWHRTVIPESMYLLSHDILWGKYKDETKGALFFHSKDAEPFNRTMTIRIGNQLFYK
jgi:spore germination cell wall hydrolase CwlJ-like protein